VPVTVSLSIEESETLLKQTLQKMAIPNEWTVEEKKNSVVLVSSAWPGLLSLSDGEERLRVLHARTIIPSALGVQTVFAVHFTDKPAITPLMQGAREDVLDRIVKLDKTMSPNQAQLLCTMMRNEAKFFVVTPTGNSTPNGMVVLIPYDLQPPYWVMSLPTDGTNVQYNRVDRCPQWLISTEEVNDMVNKVRNHIVRLTRKTPIVLRQPSNMSIFGQQDDNSNETDGVLARTGPAGPFPNGAGGGGPIKNGLGILNLPVSIQSTSASGTNLFRRLSANSSGFL
jgi:hypothetical protein